MKKASFITRGNVGHVLDQIAVLDGGVGDARDVRFLEAVFAQHGPNDLAAEHDHGNRVGHGGEQSGHRIGRPRTRGHHHDTGFAGGAGVTIGHVRGALLVAGEDQLDFRLVERIEKRDGRSPWQPKHDFDPFTLQTLHHLVAARGSLARGNGLRSCLATKVRIFSRT
jgi:hypothetical protein